MPRDESHRQIELGSQSRAVSHHSSAQKANSKEPRATLWSKHTRTLRSADSRCSTDRKNGERERTAFLEFHLNRIADGGHSHPTDNRDLDLPRRFLWQATPQKRYFPCVKSAGAIRGRELGASDVVAIPDVGLAGPRSLFLEAALESGPWLGGKKQRAREALYFSSSLVGEKI